jgi:hypothetical protein
VRIDGAPAADGAIALHDAARTVTVDVLVT